MTASIPSETPAGTVLAVVADLFFASKIEATARLGGVAVRVVRTAEAALHAWPAAIGAVVDLNIATGDAVELVRRMKAARPDAPITAFLAHVQVELANEARAAGADVVLPRSRFAAQLVDLLCETAAGRVPPPARPARGGE